MCQLISKMTVGTPERRHLSTPEACLGPICVQKSTISFDVYTDFSACTKFFKIASAFRLT